MSCEVPRFPRGRVSSEQAKDRGLFYAMRSRLLYACKNLDRVALSTW
jgi:hypothetical protein